MGYNHGNREAAGLIHGINGINGINAESTESTQNQRDQRGINAKVTKSNRSLYPRAQQGLLILTLARQLYINYSDGPILD